MYQFLRCTVQLPDPLDDWAPWCRVMCDRPGRFRGWVKRVKRLAVLRLTCGAALFALGKCFRELGAPRDAVSSGHDSTVFTEACLPCRIAFSSRPAWACHASKLHGYRTKATVLTAGLTGHWCRACGKMYASAGRLRRHVAYSLPCQDRWGAFCPEQNAVSLTVHPSAPPVQLPGHPCLADGSPGSPLVHPGLFTALMQLVAPDEATVWETVVEFIEHLRVTLQAWGQHDQAQAEAADLAATVVLLLDPDLCCDSFRRKGQLPKGLHFFPAFDTPVDFSLSFVLSGPVFRLRLDPPPLPEYRYPFLCSVPLAAAEQQTGWFEAACDTLGALLQQAQVAPVLLVANRAALDCLEPATTWLRQGGFELCPEGLRSPPR